MLGGGRDAAASRCICVAARGGRLLLGVIACSRTLSRCFPPDRSLAMPPRSHKRRRVVVVEELDEEHSQPRGSSTSPRDRGRDGADASPTASTRALAAPSDARTGDASVQMRSGSAGDDTAVRLVDWTFRDVDSYAIAKTGRAQLEAELDTKLSSLTYGEISVGAFVQLLRTLPEPETPPHFIDIGSGTGKAVLAAALAHTLASAVGVELVPQLHDTAVRARATLGQLLNSGDDPGNSQSVVLDAGAFSAARGRWRALGRAGIGLYCGDSFKSRTGQGEPEWVQRLCPLPPQHPVGLAWVYAPCACFDSQMVRRSSAANHRQ